MQKGQDFEFGASISTRATDSGGIRGSEQLGAVDPSENPLGNVDQALPRITIRGFYCETCGAGLLILVSQF